VAIGMTKLVLVLLVAFVAAAYATSAQEQFAGFVTKYQKTYETPEEYSRRFAIFQKNMRIAAAQNAAHGGKATFGVTKFSDLTQEEFRSKILMPKGSVKHNPNKNVATYPSLAAAPTEWDWATKGAVTPVKDQGQCGSCWAFSATEAIESQWFLAGNSLPTLAPQQIVDCDKGRGDEGCNGGDTVTAYAYIKAAGGQESESNYPYTAEDGKCAFSGSKVVAKVTGFNYITQNLNETQMADAMVTAGPLSICVEADTWQNYNGGILTKNCGLDLDHCVMITGFRNQGNTPIWLVRNSWGADWGEQGYIYIQRGKNLCGVAEEVTVPTV